MRLQKSLRILRIGGSCAFVQRLQLINHGTLLHSLAQQAPAKFIPLHLVYLSTPTALSSAPPDGSLHTRRLDQRPSQRLRREGISTSSPMPSRRHANAIARPDEAGLAHREEDAGPGRSRKPGLARFGARSFQSRTQQQTREHSPAAASPAAHPAGAVSDTRRSRTTPAPANSLGSQNRLMRSRGSKPGAPAPTEVESGRASTTAPLRPNRPMIATEQAVSRRPTLRLSGREMELLRPILRLRPPEMGHEVKLSALHDQQFRGELRGTGLVKKREPVDTGSQLLNAEPSTDRSARSRWGDVCLLRSIAARTVPVVCLSDSSAGIPKERTRKRRPPLFPPLALSFVQPAQARGSQSSLLQTESVVEGGSRFERGMSNEQTLPSRSLSPAAIDPDSGLSPVRRRQDLPDLRLLADRVYEQIVERIRKEKERTGGKTYA